MGQGKILNIRTSQSNDDGSIYKVQLESWTLAYACKVIVYTRDDKLLF